MLNSAYDVVVLGAGPAGLAAAIAIRNSTSATVLVIDKQSQGEIRVGESCPPDIVLLLKKLGVAKAFFQSDHQTCPGYASVWGRAKTGYNDFIVNPLGPSWRLNRLTFDKMLADKVQSCGAQISWSTRFIDAKKQQDTEQGYSLRLARKLDATPTEINARFVVDATGAKACFAGAMRINKPIDDKLFATVRFATLSRGRGSKQIQLEAIEQGWCYHALLPAQKVVSMIVTDTKDIPRLRKDGYQGFDDTLANTSLIGASLEKIELKDTSYHTYAIRPGMLPAAEGTNWMAIGDAVSSFDPIAAQGIYKGLNHGLQAGAKVAAWFDNIQPHDSTFSEQIKKQYSDYKRNRDYVYSLERRFQQSDFWLNRLTDRAEDR